ncbi:MAG: leucyl/phenylalanyl-tRNA--protein transferase [Planctomycetes bacterium]|nr:leucyl/phenylalanyl-tRNA--protein transferase [Planctomycetota bacterium]
MHGEVTRPDLAPAGLLAAYSMGVFPMADETGALHWLAPDPRAILELDALQVSRSLRSVMRRGVFELTINRAFAEVIRRCADRGEGTWISPEIRAAYCRLHQMGYAHSVEAWRDGALAGGLYGVAIGGAFFGESMFHAVSNASKAALVSLVERLRRQGFVLLDVQFMTEHLHRLGAVEIPRREYERRLRRAIRLPRRFAEAPTA